MILILINWLSRGKDAFVFRLNWKDRAIIPAMIFFLAHLVGLLWTENIDFGLFDVQIKLPIFLLPLGYASFEFFSKSEFHKILSGFVYGSLVAVLIGIVNAIYVYVTGQSPILDFYKVNISPVLHIGYFAMYLNMALVIVIYQILSNSERFYSVKNALNILLSMVFALAIFLSTSRNQFLVMILIILLLYVYGIVRYRRWVLGIMTILTIWIGASTLLKDIGKRDAKMHGFDKVAELVKNEGQVDKKAEESTAVRVLVWQSAFELIKSNPLLGVGTGDIKDELVRIYSNQEYESILKKKLNAHNQYLQSWAALGPIGLLSLLLAFVFPFINAVRSSNFVLGLFAITMGFACLTESILEVQAGAVFYGFLLTIFVYGDQQGVFSNFKEGEKLN